MSILCNLTIFVLGLSQNNNLKKITYCVMYVYKCLYLWHNIEKCIVGIFYA